MTMYVTFISLLAIIVVVVPYTQGQPINDECVDAIDIDASSNVTINGDTTDADPTDIFGNLYQSVWYQDESSIDEIIVGTVCAEDITLYPAVTILRDESCESREYLFEYIQGIAEFGCISFEATIQANVVFRMFIYLVDSEYANAEGKFVMTLSSRMANPPPNDECIEAIVIDTTSNETIKGDTTDARVSFIPDINIFPGVWYTTATSSVGKLVTATICSEDSTLSARVEVYTGENCESLVDTRLTTSHVGGCFSVTYPNEENQLYWLAAHVEDENNIFDKVGTFNMTLRSVEIPPNAECANAILIDPIIGQEVIGTPYEFNYLYYKSEGVFGNDIAITATLCTGDGVYNSLRVYDNDCDNSNFMSTDGSGVCSSYTFIPYKNFTYIYGIYAFDESGISAEYSFSVATTHTFLELIDSTVDTGIGALQNEISYGFFVSSSRLNIRANFDASIPVESVRLTLTNPTRSICERVAPYSLFGDINGNYKNGTIPLGTHVVTATPYAQRSCRGPAGPQLTQTFKVYGCEIFYSFLYEGDFFPIDRSSGYVILPCPFNIEMYVRCGFVPAVVRFDLRNTATNRIIRSVRDSTYPSYELYNGVVGKLGAGNYTIAATIDGIYHPHFETLVVNETCV